MMTVKVKGKTSDEAAAMREDFRVIRIVKRCIQHLHQCCAIGRGRLTRQIWLNTSHSREQLANDLQAWCKRAEESGIAALRDFSMKLRSVRVRTA